MWVRIWRKGDGPTHRKGADYFDSKCASFSSHTGATAMKKLITAAIFLVLAVLYIGYYEGLEDGDIEAILFIEKKRLFR